MAASQEQKKQGKKPVKRSSAKAAAANSAEVKRRPERPRKKTIADKRPAAGGLHPGLHPAGGLTAPNPAAVRTPGDV
ncbi:hypothetical protein ABBQ32_002531 [Trebouxia sp. C0010 RCD-2024]